MNLDTRRGRFIAPSADL